MTKFADTKSLRMALWLVLMLGCVSQARAGVYQHGTVVRMRMGECLPTHNKFMFAMAGPAAQAGPDLCPEYTLLSEKVVFVIVGRCSDQLVPLADTIDFRLQSNELAVRVDDARRESKFSIKEMILRSEWNRMQKHIADEMDSAASPSQTSLGLRAREP
jgi:hypothetical protein